MTTRSASEENPELIPIPGRSAEAPGPRFWRSLEELAGTPEFQEYLAREFPSQASEWTDPTSRRNFLRLMGASLALAGVAGPGCAIQPPETIVPYVKQPEQVVPGKPLFYASAMTLGGFATGILVAQHMGRPIKIEGNEDHPASLGATDVFMQAATLGLYDPDRSRVVLRNGRVSTWDDFVAILINERQAKIAKKGAGLHILTETITSPTLAHHLEELLKELPEAKWHQHEPVSRDNARAGAKLAFGQDVEPIHHFDKADVVFALDSDFLNQGPAKLRDARAFAARREPEHEAGMNRLYVVEPSPTITGSMADHRLPVPARKIVAIARAVAQAIGVAGVTARGEPPVPEAWLKTLVADLKAHRGASLVLAGEGQPPEVHALTLAINHALGNIGQTIEFIAPVEANPVDQKASFLELVEAMKKGQVDALLILGGNPVYTAPADINFAKLLDRVRFSVHLGLYEDETSAHCHWHIPEAHFLESWGDARAFDGTAAVQQPLIRPLYGGKTPLEIVAVLRGQPSPSGLELVREYWQSRKLADDFESFWRSALHDGVIPQTKAEVKSVTLQPLQPPAAEPKDEGGLEILFRPDPTIYDGRFANNGWLQELPKPVYRTTWDNAAMMSKRTAERLGLTINAMESRTDEVELTYRGRKLRLPAWIVPGQADDTITVHLGYGRTAAGRVGTNLGANAYALRTSDAPWFDGGLEARRTGATLRIATVQHHFNMEDRDLIRVATIDAFRKDPHVFQAVEHETPGEEEPPRSKSLFPDPSYQWKHEAGEGNAWGMAINLNTCIGCGACVIACQAENNIPVVGKEQVVAGREMHWIRVDRYYEGDDANPKVYHQPVPCMHCEKAPCELVCPVAATVHDAEGLNVMIYNRCVGTRYCSNNCPYKVRRFNFLQYSDQRTPSLKLLNNPDVTVRSRGVMEKCTYCIQRLTRARIEAEQQNRTRVLDGEVQTACQAACPTRAIVFGNLNDRSSEVVRLKEGPRNYGLLSELNTQPRTTYLAKLTNPNTSPEMKAE
ncbi:MAG: TAT-variant-translocated molybdopterin oxidoreductase [Isosphaeraceae bacterium]|nr:TAT-variant-translocated molybdopterin oxidoreductase [Isosphaeraceae bacterium]